MISILLTFIGSLAVWSLLLAIQQRSRKQERKGLNFRPRPEESEVHANAPVGFVLPLLALGVGVISLVLENELREALSGEAGLTKTGVFVLLCVCAGVSFVHLFRNSGTHRWKS